ncbi:Uncharacterised protein [Mycobacterium tuberculosis]|nr:Uncharacterised protein [Mycobacterium tuberculosis]
MVRGAGRGVPTMLNCGMRTLAQRSWSRVCTHTRSPAPTTRITILLAIVSSAATKTRDSSPASVTGIISRSPLLSLPINTPDGPISVTSCAGNGQRRCPRRCGRGPHMLAAAAAACSPLSRRKITLGGVGAGVGVRTVMVAVHVASGYTVTFWMTSSARSVQACERTRDEIASAGYAYVVIHPASPRIAFQRCALPATASDPSRRSSSAKSVAVASLARKP